MEKSKNSGDSSLDSAELFALARRDLDAGRVEEALLKLKAVISGPDAIAEALPYAARVYAQLGLMEKARSCYQRYLEARPDAVLESFELGITYFESGQKAEAKKIWERLLGSQPTHPPTLFYSGLLAAQEGRMPEAQRNLDVLFKSTPADNLYVTRARDLLRDIESGSLAASDAAPRPDIHHDAAKTGH